MKNGDQPIHPCMMQKVGDNEYRLQKDGDPKEWGTPVSGMTKREHFASMAMQSITLNAELFGVMQGNHIKICRLAIEFADTLLRELENKKATEAASQV